MKIIKFRIKNYKSIIDSGDCYLTDNTTILAGKNESGKTSILEALEDFNIDKNIRKEAEQIKNPDALPEIKIMFEIEKSDLEKIFTDIGIEKPDIENIKIEISKIYPNQYSISDKSLSELRPYSISDKSLSKLKQEDDAHIEININKSYNKLDIFRKDFQELIEELPILNFNEIDDFKTSIYSVINEANSKIDRFPDEQIRNEFISIKDELINNLNKLDKLKGIEEQFLSVLKTNWIPYFILFKSFEDEFPHTVPISDLEDNEWIKDLSEISDLDPKIIKSSDSRLKFEHKDKINIDFKKDFKDYWTQDFLSLKVEWDSDDVSFWIEEDNSLYKPSQRSKGHQWYLAFYVKITARAKENVPNIILIDEPGLFLHAKAQSDILRKLEDSASHVQLIFSTHSPYLLEANKLNRIRLVYKTKESGTLVENKVHSLADKETLTPILTTIGLDLNSGISHLNKLNNVIVEGISDVFYLEAFKRMKDNDDFNFVFGGGSGNMPVIGTILHGWGCNVIYLYDKDQGKKDGEKNLSKNWHVKKDFILSVLENKGTIEDIFSTDDFKNYVINDSSKTYTSMNSEYIKTEKMDKALLARHFLQSTEDEDIKLSSETMDNVKGVFDKLNKCFNDMTNTGSETLPE